MPSHVNGVTPSHAAKNQAPSLLEQATGALSWQDVKDLINMSRGIGTPAQALQKYAKKIVGNTDIDTVDEKQLIEAFGTTDRYFARGLLGQAIKAGSIGGNSRSGTLCAKSGARSQGQRRVHRPIVPWTPSRGAPLR